VTSHRTERFRKSFQQLPPAVQRKARATYRLWLKDPWNPLLHFKQVHEREPVYSVRIDIGWRALGVRKDEVVIWFWIGSHADYDKLLEQMNRR
jgi:hypothetical protein